MANEHELWRLIQQDEQQKKAELEAKEQAEEQARQNKYASIITEFPQELEKTLGNDLYKQLNIQYEWLPVSQKSNIGYWALEYTTHTSYEGWSTGSSVFFWPNHFRDLWIDKNRNMQCYVAIFIIRNHKMIIFRGYNIKENKNYCYVTCDGLNPHIGMVSLINDFREKLFNCMKNGWLQGDFSADSFKRWYS